MIKNVFTLIITSFIFSAGLASAQEKPDIVIGKRIKLHSKILNSDREIMISLPDSYQYNNYNKYPVLYLLDGDKYFNPFAGIISLMSGDATPQIPQMILVGISSQDRVKDSSPTHSEIGYSGKKEEGYENSGGAGNFINFIKTELIPYVDGNYRTNNYRMLVGYSFTGLPVLHSLFTQPDIFDSYLAIDFSAWWDNEITLRNMGPFFKSYKGKRKDVFVSTVDVVISDAYPVKDNKTWDFIQYFEQEHPDSIRFGYKKYDYKQESHHTAPLISFIDGLKYLFRGYMINDDEIYSNPDKIKLRFDKLSERLGYKVVLREDLVNYFGYEFLYKNVDLDKALFYFKYNTENYPLSDNAWDSLAEAYKVKGDKANAIACYKKALILNPGNENSKKSLKGLMEN